MMEQNKIKATVLNSALFLDVDGTLLDIADTPDAVKVPPNLPQTLAHLSECFKGAIALITGREIAFIDTLFPNLNLPVAGLHGAELRLEKNKIRRQQLSENFLKAKAYLKQAADDLMGVAFEDKNMAAALHYRNALSMQAIVKEQLEKAAQIAGTGWAVQHGKMVAELRPADCDKGTALLQIMQLPAFIERKPYAFGDDLTDEQMFYAAVQSGGAGIRIAENTENSAAALSISSPAILRQWLLETTQKSSNENIFSNIF
ncbi:trehalose-phosphatase [Paenochrobactrum pullorum]|uniref:trehalose-phosphatase n=1 Tax=Paenochrobactrum pullorum TaxID=1324351 RepID=UPI0035BC5EFD